MNIIIEYRGLFPVSGNYRTRAVHELRNSGSQKVDGERYASNTRRDR